ncbi:allergen Tha p 1 [Plutella xylostella]|uniref:allergen Tha p 1 n=1 Tax=Plutella xylostella TaxID=51655 RepID=UPI00203219B4|nr:allergen Tha p 1 [Plutella xylostella]
MSHLFYIRLILVLAVVSIVVGDFYSSRYDNFDITPLLENDRILLGYTKCFLDQGPCTPDAKDFKKVIPEALQTVCGKCTPKQGNLIKVVVRTLRERHPESWELLLDRYDSEKKFREEFDKFLLQDD